jgi:NitT/TauT family transport system substrate-binding protein
VSVRRHLAHPARLAGCLLIIAAHMLLERPAAGEKLTLGVSAVGAGQSGLFMAVEGRFFERQGLDVELLFIGSGTEATQAVLSGRLVASLVGGPSPVNATLAGGELVWIAGLVNVLPYVLMVSPEVTTPADLKGKQLGVNRLGTSAELAARYALTRLGLNPQADVTVLQIGEQAARLAALQARSIQATLLEPPGTVVARRLGFRELANLAAMKLYFPHEALTTSRRVVRERPDTLRKLVTGLVLGAHAFKTRRDEGIQILRKYLKLDSPRPMRHPPT